jgi:multidrug efflux pump
MTQTEPKEGFNLSKWALDHPALTRYLMVVLMLLGFAAYFQLGQDEDPPFTFRAMVVRTYWPGATAQQVAEQVTDKIERTLQEVPYADIIRSYSKPGESQIIFQIKDSSKAAEVTNVWYHGAQEGGRHALHLARGHAGAVLQRRVRRRVRRDLRAGVRWRLQLRRAQGPVADDVRQRLLRVPGRQQGRAVRCAGREAVRRDLAKAPGPAGPGHEPGASPRWASRTPWNRPARCRRRWTWCRCAWAGQFNSVEKTCAPCPSGRSGNQLRLGHRGHPRGYVDPVTIKVRHQGKDSHCAGCVHGQGRRHHRPGQALKPRVARIETHLPAGMQLVQVQDQPRNVSDRSMSSSAC